MKCRTCFSELEEDYDFCLRCGSRNVLLCGLHSGDVLTLVLVGDSGVRYLTFKEYGEWESRRNLYEVVWEKLHRKRAGEVVVSGRDVESIVEAERMLRLTSLYSARILTSEPLPLHEFAERLERFVRVRDEIPRVSIPAGEKIGGAHSTIIGGREGRDLVMRLASSEFVKKVVPGVIENKGTTTGSVRLKLTRCDDRGNIRGLLIHGGSVQQIHVITTAKNREEGEVVMRELRSLL
ncbi:DUF2103 domain-containing protein [Geoglobus ahangari]